MNLDPGTILKWPKFHHFGDQVAVIITRQEFLRRTGRKASPGIPYLVLESIQKPWYEKQCYVANAWQLMDCVQVRSYKQILKELL